MPIAGTSLLRNDVGSKVAEPKLSWRLTVAIAFVFATAFFVRHIAGYAISGREYTPFVYSTAEIRAASHTQFDFRPDDTVWDEMRAYARGTHGMMRGELLGATIDSYQPYLQDGKAANRKWFIRDGIGQVLLAGIARLPGSSVVTAFVVADFIFVFLCSVTLTRLCFTLRPSASCAIAGTALVLFFNWRDLLNALHFLHGAPQNSSMFLRTPYPQVAFPALLVSLLLVIALTRNPTSRRGTALGFALALNSYTYFYSWTFAYAAVAAVAVLVFVEEGGWVTSLNIAEGKHRKILAWMLLAMCIGLVCSEPVWAGVAQKSAAVTDSFLRINGELTHALDIRGSVPLLIALLALAFWKRRGGHVHWLTFAIIIASLLVLNVQVVVGKTIQPGHWTAYFIQPLLQICILDIVWNLISRRRRLQVIIASALVLCGVASTAGQFWVAAKQSTSIQTREPSFDQLVSYLREPRRAKFGFVTNDVYLTNLLPAYVPQKPLMPSYMDPVSDAELSQLQLAAAEVAGYDSWADYANVSGSAAKPNETVVRLHYRKEVALIVENRHRPSTLPPPERCTAMENADFRVLAPCEKGIVSER